MKHTFTHLLLAGGLAVSFASAANSNQLQEITNECQEWAVEDQVDPDFLDDYLQSCIKETLAGYEESTETLDTTEQSELDRVQQEGFLEATD
ncbi:hypothetical protein [Pelagibaculum spongiae]|uniref:Uncharacterized protein n=1 Tax=Pelagibaculum spongiae TaxID=2080658 RepID=A0A2V1GTY9_9GAMM|nr:hypothetical protein [Pelagibaculum spongiae]PVZ65638.1 hypothetical protein DC094_17275 [Pelagibaculum spongiae]